jgi:N-acetylmuramoyl-L-alanine amidase
LTRIVRFSSLQRALALAACLLALSSAACGGLRLDRSHPAISQDSRVQFIVLHYTSLPFEAALERLSRGPVSSHYLVSDETPPRIFQLVEEERRAWHAGESAWQGRTALNAASIGIELVNAGHGPQAEGPYAPYPPAQLERVIELVREIQQRHGVRPHWIVGHNELQPQTKEDPGPLFPWRRLFDEGLIPWPDEAQVAAALPRFQERLPEPAWFQERLAAYGFSVPRTGVHDEATRRVLATFQMKFRPARFDGAPDAETAALLEVVTAPGGLLLKTPAGIKPYQPQ